MTEAILDQVKINSVLKLFSDGQLQTALDLIDTFLEDYPNESILFNIQGACHAELGSFEIAVKSYEQAILINSGYAKAYFNLAGTLHEMQDLDASVERYKQSLKIEPENEAALNNLGNVYIDLDDHSNAIECYRKALEIKPDYVEALYSQGSSFYTLGQLQEAIKSYEKLLIIRPSIAGVRNNLGNIYRELGDTDSAIQSYRQAIKIEPKFVQAFFNLGIVLNEVSDFDDAITVYELAVNIKPDYFEAHNNLGAVFKEIGQIEKAIKSYEKSLQINPNYVEAINNYGVALKELGRLNEALDAHKRAVEIDPESCQHHNNLGIVNMEIGNLDEAVKNYDEAININPDYKEAFNNLASVYKDLGQLDSAIENYKKALFIDPNYVEALNNVGIVYKELGDIDAAINTYSKAIDIKPDYVYALNNLGLTFNEIGDFEASVKYLKKAIKIKPDYFEALSNHGNLMIDMGNLEEALISYEGAYKYNPNFEKNLGDIIHTKMHLCIWDDFMTQAKELEKNIKKGFESISPFALLGIIDDPLLHYEAAHSLISKKHPRNNILPILKSYSDHKKIRLGYFSADFREHPVSDLIVELLEVHNRDQFEIHAFSCGKDTKDKMNLRIKASVDHFHNVHMKPDKDVAMLVRSYEIDIAIDLGGFTQGNRTEIFAMLAAPIQVCYLGYAGTMGADYMDYLICDRIVIPEDKQNFYSENLAYLPNSYMANDSKIVPSEGAYTRKNFELPAEGFVFCCFNSTYKITPETFTGWMNILSKVDGSVLWLSKTNSTAIQNLKKEAQKLGINPNRLIFASRLDAKEDHLKRIQSADLFLDTLPFNAHTTTSDALRVGLPVLTRIGESFTSRVAASLLNAVNLPELITSSQEEYEALAIELATDADKLKIIKDKLAQNLPTAPLYDTALFTQHIESAYKTMYERHHQGLKPEHIYVEH